MKYMLKLLVLFSLPLVMSSCDLLRDNPFEVSSWSPGDGYFPSFSQDTLIFVFSHDADRLSVERSFTLTENGTKVFGYFSWSGRTMYFRPAVPMQANCEYRITIVSDAMDTKGISMDENFYGLFYTRPEAARPYIVSVTPQDDGTMSNLRGKITIIFSEPIDPLSCVNSIFLTPSIQGSWQLDGSGTSAEFTPGEPYRNNTLYHIRLTQDFSSVLGITLGKEYQFRFRTGTDDVAPELLGAYALDTQGQIVFQLSESDISSPVENSNWETLYRLQLVFSEAVSDTSLKSHLSLVPSGGLIIESLPGHSDTFIFRFNEKPQYENRLTIKVAKGIADSAGNVSKNDYIFHLFVNGINSKPPALVGIRLPLSPGEALEADWDMVSYSIDDIYDDVAIESGTNKYTHAVPVSTWIELYFDTAPGTGINPFSLMDLFRMEATNNALSFSPRSVKTNASDFTCTAPYSPWAGYTRVEIQGLLTNDPNSGIVSFTIRSGLEDSLGNTADKPFILPLLK
jgi:hypothetical protein